MSGDLESRVARLEANQRALATVAVAAAMPIPPLMCRGFRLATWKREAGSSGHFAACDAHKDDGMVLAHADVRITEILRAVNALVEDA